jgi:hypothetical protein
LRSTKPGVPARILVASILKWRTSDEYLTDSLEMLRAPSGSEGKEP